MNLVPCTTWVRKGIAAAVPETIQITPNELKNIIRQTQSELHNTGNDTDEENDKPAACISKDTKHNEKDSDVSKNYISGSDEYNFDNYDEENSGMYCTMDDIVSFGEDGKDPLITANDTDEDSEKEDDIIKPSDNLVLLGHVEGDASVLEIYVYNEDEGSFYCHHDILLTSFPLCLEWLNFDPTDLTPGNLCAIGNMTPIIEIWDLDLINCLEPVYKLGAKPSKKKKKKRIGHKDAVLDIAWNKNYTHVLASGSVDETVLLWDLENACPVTTLDSFDEKVQSLKWHPTETHQLLTGCADKVVNLFDCRAADSMKNWKVSGEVEKVIWNHFDTNYCIAGTHNGFIEYIDVRQSKPVWQLTAHEQEVTGLSLSSSCPGLLLSCANDGVIKVWDIIDNTQPHFVWTKKGKLGALQCLAPSPDSPFLFALGGDNKTNHFTLMDFAGMSDVRNRFMDRINIKSIPANYKLQDNTRKRGKQEEMMDVTENMESMILSSNSAKAKLVKKRSPKK